VNAAVVGRSLSSEIGRWKPLGNGNDCIDDLVMVSVVINYGH
jgi:hypothetical protein